MDCFRMVLILLFFSSIVLTSANIDTDEVDCRPEQVHIAYGDSLSEMIVIWSTIEECSTDVEYGIEVWGDKNKVTGTSELLPGETSNFPYLHRVKLTGLAPEKTYFYIPESNDITNGVFYFKTPPQGPLWQPEFLIYGDLGVHSLSIPNITKEVLKGSYSAVLHVGDFGYNLFDKIEYGKNMGENVGDVFMREIQGMASHVPYMVCPGNHEQEGDNFYQYRYRFSMPNTDWPIPLSSMFYSYDIGPVHFISYSTEVYFVSAGKYIKTQEEWILRDLQNANKNRHTRPWVIAYGHRPMYCSNGDGDDCTKQESYVRTGLEDLFYENGVDIVLQAHEHSYERLWPTYKGVVLAYNYTNPPAPVQLITGAAGSRHGVDEMNTTLNETWSAFRMDNKSFNSYGSLKVYNATHVFWEQIAVLTGEVLDSIWVTQESHGPFKQSALLPEQKEKITEQKKIDDKIKESRNPKPEIAGDSLKEKVTKVIKGIDIKVIVGVSIASVVVLFLLIVCIARKCRRRTKSYRRWEQLDYGKKFYTNLKHDEKDMDDFEVDVTDGTTKLIDGSVD